MWKDIPDSKYQAAEKGLIRHRKFKRILRHFNGSHGYPAVQFNKRTQLVHRLILLAFRGNPPSGYWARHLDGNVKNCHLSNLEWATAKENSHDKKKHGTEIWGERNGLAKLNAIQVCEIRRLYIPRHTDFCHRALAKKFGVSIATIGSIIRRRTWPHI